MHVFTVAFEYISKIKDAADKNGAKKTALTIDRKHFSVSHRQFILNLQNVISKNVPVQVNPSPWKPTLHVHVYGCP